MMKGWCCGLEDEVFIKRYPTAGDKVQGRKEARARLDLGNV